MDNDVDDARDLVLDLGADGEIVGYDIQHTLRRPGVIAEPLAELRRAQGAAGPSPAGGKGLPAVASVV